MSPTELFAQKPTHPTSPSDLRGNAKKDIFELKLHKHGMSMVNAQQAVLSSRNFPEDFKVVVPFISKDDNADDDIKPISGTCSL